MSALASITGIVAEGIRASLRFDAGRRGGGERTSPGLMLLGPRNEVEMITPPARELLDLMSSGARSGNGEVPPNAVLALAEYTRRGPAGDEARTVAVPTGAGWITLHASLPDGSTAGRVAIVVERALSPAATAVAPKPTASPRASRDRRQRRRRPDLPRSPSSNLSPHTSGPHQDLLYKTGVSSRQELVARIFLDDYLPRIAAGAPLDSTGQFTAG
jgi:hypothetical protein